QRGFIAMPGVDQDHVIAKPSRLQIGYHGLDSLAEDRIVDLEAVADLRAPAIHQPAADGELAPIHLAISDARCRRANFEVAGKSVLGTKPVDYLCFDHCPLP